MVAKAKRETEGKTMSSYRLTHADPGGIVRTSIVEGLANAKAQAQNLLDGRWTDRVVIERVEYVVVLEMKA